jgi:hypothetical protein
MREKGNSVNAQAKPLMLAVGSPFGQEAELYAVGRFAIIGRDTPVSFPNQKDASNGKDAEMAEPFGPDSSKSVAGSVCWHKPGLLGRL